MHYCPLINYYGIIVTITLLYLDKAGVPLSVIFKMKCAVSGLSTSGAVKPELCAFSGALTFMALF